MLSRSLRYQARTKKVIRRLHRFFRLKTSDHSGVIARSGFCDEAIPNLARCVDVTWGLLRQKMARNDKCGVFLLDLYSSKNKKLSTPSPFLEGVNRSIKPSVLVLQDALHHSFLWPTTRAGAPTAMDMAGMLSVTTAPAPMIAPLPMETPSKTITPTPNQASSSMMMSPLLVIGCLEMGISGSEKPCW